MYDIEVKIRFRAGHRLLPPYSGKCNNPHGEGYTAIFIFSTAILDTNGMVMDFSSTKHKLKKWIDENFDHAYIHHPNDEIATILKEKGFKTYNLDKQPTAENIAEHLYNVFKSEFPLLRKVGIIESFDDSIAWYGGD